VKASKKKKRSFAARTYVSKRGVADALQCIAISYIFATELLLQSGNDFLARLLWKSIPMLYFNSQQYRVAL
jgi:hypothetical protein